VSDVRAVTTESRQPSPGQPRWVLPVVALLIALASISSGIQAAVRGVDRLTWDECEYIEYTLRTYDQLEMRGLIAWPLVVATDQHHVKPTLLVNALIPAIWLSGRDNLGVALGLFFGLTVAGLLVAVAAMARVLYSPRSMLPAVLAVGAMPAVGYFSRSVYPTVPLCFLTLAAIGVLLWPGNRATARRAVLFGFVIGLGMMAKTTFPVLVVGPITLWFFNERRASSMRARLGFLALAAVVAAVVVAPWYLDNWRGALDHATMSYGWTNQGPQPPLEILRDWGETLVIRGFGVTTFSLVVTAAVLWWSCRRKPSGDHRYPPATFALLLSAGPLLAVAMTSVNVMDRLVLPALACLVFAAAAALGRLEMPTVGRVVRVVVLSGAALQFTVVQLGWLARPGADEPRILRKAERILDPFAGWLLRPVDHRPAEDVLTVLEKLARESEYPRCLLLTDFVELNVFRLRMVNQILRAPFLFGWGSYFSWPAEQVPKAIRGAGKTPTILVWYRPLVGPFHRGDTLNRHAIRARDAVRDEASGFELLRHIRADDESYEIEIYQSSTGFSTSAFSTILPVEAEFGGRIRMEQIAVGEGRVSITCVCLARVERNFNLLIHASEGGMTNAPVESWDRAIKPPTTMWRPGDRFQLEYTLRKARPGVNYRLEIGFFEEVRFRRHRWRRMSRSDLPGADAVTIVVTPLEADSGNATPIPGKAEGE